MDPMKRSRTEVVVPSHYCGTRRANCHYFQQSGYVEDSMESLQRNCTMQQWVVECMIL